MANFIATYDIERVDRDAHTAFKDEAKFLGWSDTIPLVDGSRCDLPNTTLVGDFRDVNEAIATLEVARQSASSQIDRTIKMPRMCILPFGIGAAYSQKDRGPELLRGGGFAGYRRA